MLGNFSPVSVEVFPTGSLCLDVALGVGGLPRGQIAEIYGPESSGKTTLALHLIAEAQRRGFTALFVDMEHSLDAAYAKKCGVDIDSVLLSEPQKGVEALQIIKRALVSGNIDLVVLDSIAALVPSEEAERQTMHPASGGISQLLPTALRELSLACMRNNASLVCTNQLRRRLKTGYGLPETTPGGLSVKLHSAARISLKTKKLLRHEGKIIGSQIEARITKNTVAPSFHSAIFNIVYNMGISKGNDLLRLGQIEKIITQRGSQYWYGEQNLGQGRRQAEKFLNGNSVAAQKLEQVLRSKLLPKPPMSMRDL
ncbi:MAG: DNA recombination/repair protein RecA [Chloroflexota bacterium]|nr:MAG: DNA recombination/repair protein RecA [Chloroflexota bacterium]